MAVTFRSQSSVNTGSTPTASLVLSLPSGVQSGDMLVAAVGADLGTGVNFTAPAGWNLMQSSTQATNARLSTYWRVADGSEPGSYTWTFDTAIQASGAIVAYSGVHPFAPLARSSSANATANTTLTPTSVQSSYIGVSVQIFVTKNTTSAASITPAAGATERVDVCTTASSFINLEIQDMPKAYPVGGSNVSTSTSTQPVTFTQHTFFLSEARPEFNWLGIDEITGGSSTSSVSSASLVSAFTTNYPNELIICVISIEKSVQTVTGITGAGLTWELVGRSNTRNGSVEVWRTFAYSQLNRQVFTATFSGTVTGCNLMLMGIRGADSTGVNGSGAIGATIAGTSTAAAPSITLTTTRSNSWVWGAFSDPDASRVMTAGAGQTITRSFSDTINNACSWMQMQNNLTPAPGTAVTMNASAPNTDSCNAFAFEIVPARKPRPVALFFQ